MVRYLFLWVLLCVGATTLVLLYAPDSRESDEVFIEGASNPFRGSDTTAFISQLQEPWNFFTKEVYRDFLDQNALQSTDFDKDTLFDAQVIRLYQKEDFDEILSQLRNYENLEALSLVECRLGKTQFEDLVTVLKDKERFKKLMVSHSNIRSVPHNLFHLRRLETLGLSHNRLQEIQEEVGDLSQLKYLDISHNRSLQKLPARIGELKMLELLDISACSIDSIPDSIGECLALKSFIANAGTLKYVPGSIGECRQLINLNLGYNQIADLPSEIGGLENLGVLMVGHNPYDSIPMSYKNLSKLFHFQ